MALETPRRPLTPPIPAQPTPSPTCLSEGQTHVSAPKSACNQARWRPSLLLVEWIDFQNEIIEESMAGIQDSRGELVNSPVRTNKKTKFRNSSPAPQRAKLCWPCRHWQRAPRCGRLWTSLWAWRATLLVWVQELPVPSSAAWQPLKFCHPACQ